MLVRKSRACSPMKPARKLSDQLDAGLDKVFLQFILMPILDSSNKSCWKKVCHISSQGWIARGKAFRVLLISWYYQLYGIRNIVYICIKKPVEIKICVYLWRDELLRREFCHKPYSMWQTLSETSFHTTFSSAYSDHTCNWAPTESLWQKIRKELNIWKYYWHF